MVPTDTRMASFGVLLLAGAAMLLAADRPSRVLPLPGFDAGLVSAEAVAAYVPSFWGFP